MILQSTYSLYQCWCEVQCSSLWTNTEVQPMQPRCSTLYWVITVTSFFLKLGIFVSMYPYVPYSEVEVLYQNVGWNHPYRWPCLYVQDNGLMKQILIMILMNPFVWAECSRAASVQLVMDLWHLSINSCRPQWKLKIVEGQYPFVLGIRLKLFPLKNILANDWSSHRKFEGGGGASISYENVNRLINFVMLIGVPTPQITFKP